MLNVFLALNKKNDEMLKESTKLSLPSRGRNCGGSRKEGSANYIDQGKTS